MSDKILLHNTLSLRQIAHRMERSCRRLSRHIPKRSPPPNKARHDDIIVMEKQVEELRRLARNGAR